MLKTLKHYSAGGSEKGMEDEDMNDVLLLSGEKQLNGSGSSAGAVSCRYVMFG